MMSGRAAFAMLALACVAAAAAQDSYDPKLKDAVANMVKEFPQLEKILQTTTTTTVVDNLVSRGFMTFTEDTSVQHITQVAYSNLDTLMGLLQQQLALPAQYQSQLDFILKSVQYEDANTWVAFRVAFAADKGAECRYVCVLARNNPDGKNTDWLIANVASSFTLAPNLLVVRESHSVLGGIFKWSEDKIKQMPASLTNDDMNVVFTFFDISVFKRFAELMGPGSDVPSLGAAPAPRLRAGALAVVPQEETAAPELSVGAGLPGAWDMIDAAIKTITSDWTSIVNAFKSGESESIVKELLGSGFDHFEESADMQKISGMDAGFLDTFIQNAVQIYGIPAAYQQQAVWAMELVKYSDSQTWNRFDIVFSEGSGGSVRNVVVLGHNNQTTGKTDWLIANMKATFSLAPDIMIIQKSKSILGGIWSSTKLIFKKMPRSLTPKTVELVFDFVEVCSFVQFAKVMGIQVQNPIIPSNATTDVVDLRTVV